MLTHMTEICICSIHAILTDIEPVLAHRRIKPDLTHSRLHTYPSIHSHQYAIAKYSRHDRQSGAALVQGSYKIAREGNGRTPVQTPSTPDIVLTRVPELRLLGDVSATVNPEVDVGVHSGRSVRWRDEGVRVWGMWRVVVQQNDCLMLVVQQKCLFDVGGGACRRRCRVAASR